MVRKKPAKKQNAKRVNAKRVKRPVKAKRPVKTTVRRKPVPMAPTGSEGASPDFRAVDEERDPAARAEESLPPLDSNDSAF